MAALSKDHQRIIAEQRLGFLASVNADGTPNLSPKGTFIVVDEQTIAFGEIRSPNTLANVEQRRAVEINFVDPFVRKGVRIKGRTEIIDNRSDGFDALIPIFEEIWGPLADSINCIIAVSVDGVLPLTSPAYDLGASEDELRRVWTNNFRVMQPGGCFVNEI